jgi:hypothetical protein
MLCYSVLADACYISFKQIFNQVIVGPITATPRVFYASPLEGIIGSDKTGFSYLHRPVSHHAEIRSFGVLQSCLTPSSSVSNVRHVVPVRSKPLIVVGPIIGKVTTNSAIVLLEVNNSAVITCILTEALTKKVTKVSKAFIANRPSTFLVDNLKSGQQYIIGFDGVANSNERQGDFTTINEDPRAMNIFVVSLDDPPCLQSKDATLWDWLKMKLRAAWTRSIKLPPIFEPRLGADIMLHVGGQVAMKNEFQKATAWIDQHYYSVKEGMSEQEIARLEHEARERLRDVYRSQWNMPTVRKVLATGSHLMMWGHEDICAGFSETPDLSPTTLRLARDVFREYQRPLWDPEPSPTDTNEYHFHRWGGVGILFLDMRGNRIHRCASNHFYNYTSLFYFTTSLSYSFTLTFTQTQTGTDQN